MQLDREPCLSDEIISDLNNIVRAIEDEGDRCYLGSTNDAERLREIANWLETKFRRTLPTRQSDEALVELVNVIGDCCDELHISQVNQLARAILPILTARESSARAEGRREGIEEAADWVEANGEGDDIANHGTANAIRALAEKQP